MMAKRRYKVRVLTQPAPSTPTSTAPTPTVVTVSTYTPMVRSTAESTPVTIHKLATGQFAEVPHPTTRSLIDNCPPLEDIPSAPVRQGTPWPNDRTDIRESIQNQEGLGLFPLLQSPHPSPPSKQKNSPK